MDDHHFCFNKKILTKNTGQQETQSWLKSFKTLEESKYEDPGHQKSDTYLWAM
jgi:hypothetical protein